MRLWFLFTLVVVASVAKDTPEVVVFRAGDDGYFSYRIPALVLSKKGTLLAFCEGRKDSRSDTGNIDLLLKRSTDNGKSWSPQITIADFGPDTIGNPAPVVDQSTGYIWLLLTSNPGVVTEKDILAGATRGTRSVWVTHSKDDGLSWAKPVDISKDTKLPEWTWYATGPGNGIQLKSGRMVIACDHNRGAEERYSHVIYSDDHGAHWKIGGVVGSLHNESTIAELSDGSLLLNMRSYAKRNRRSVATSHDGGLTFSNSTFDEALIEPVCQGSLIRLGKGRKAVLLFANPASTKRENMTVRLSRDNGQTWPVSKVIHKGPAAYSNLAGLKDGSIGLLYEKGERGPYEVISFARFRF